jgi:hypothetical protein
LALATGIRHAGAGAPIRYVSVADSRWDAAHRYLPRSWNG